MTPISSIGKCVGCGEMRRIEDDACRECRESPNRGPRWLELARKVRTDPEFALKCYLKLKDPLRREAFSKRYGTPPGAENVIPLRKI